MNRNNFDILTWDCKWKTEVLAHNSWNVFVVLT